MKVILLLSFLICSPQLWAEKSEFKALKKNEKAKDILKKLNGIILKDVKIEDLSLSEAVSTLQKLGSSRQQNSSVINYVVRTPKKAGQIKKLTLISPSISFAQAVDTLCQKAGSRWAVDFDDRKVPILVITSK